MTYQQAITYLSSFVNYEKINSYPYPQALKLKRMEEFLRSIGSPQKSFAAVHIAGSKGKGSVCAFSAYIFRASGYRTGLYTSPHLADWRERIRILDPESASEERRNCFEGMISKAHFSRLMRQLKPKIEDFNRQSKNGPLTFFEVTTAVAFVYFREKKVDLAVLETGMGGRLDATNTVNAFIRAITPISYEHRQKLGRTLSKIAQEKAGIIKRSDSIKGVVFSAAQRPEAYRVIKERCKNQGSLLFTVGKDIRLIRQGHKVNIAGRQAVYHNIKVRLPGEHQLENAALAVGIAEAAAEEFPRIDARVIVEGLRQAYWPARAELLRRRPWILLDGAHNGESIKAILQTLEENFSYRKLIVVLGVSSDKEIADICRRLRLKAAEVILTKAQTPRAAEGDLLERYFPGQSVIKTDKVTDALDQALTIAGRQDLILITGSLFVAAEARKILQKK